MASAVVSRWELSRRLLERRKELGVDVKTISETLGFTRNYWSAVERDRTLIAEDKLIALFDLLEFDKIEQDELLTLRKNARRREWWDDYADDMDPQDLRFLGLEDGAIEIHSFATLIIPALLQTDDYTRSLAIVNPAISKLQVERLLETRRRRRQRLVDRRCEYIALLSEAVLLQRWSEADTLRGQLAHLLDMADAGVSLRVLPLDAPPGIIAMAAALEMLKFESKKLPRLIWQEPVRPPTVIEEGTSDFTQIVACLDDAKERALPEARSVELVFDRMKSL